MITGSCHCGAVSFEITESPKWLVDCNCSICRRLGTLWGHIEMDSVTVNPAEGGTISYVHGDKTLAIHTCKVCGCTTHWENLQPEKRSRMAVNFRMCSESDVAAFRVRRLDGAETWEYLD